MVSESRVGCYVPNFQVVGLPNGWADEFIQGVYFMDADGA